MEIKSSNFFSHISCHGIFGFSALSILRSKNGVMYESDNVTDSSGNQEGGGMDRVVIVDVEVIPPAHASRGKGCEDDL